MYFPMIGLALLIGLIIPFQGIVTASLSQKLEHPYASALINFLVGLIVFLVAMALSSANFPTFKKLSSVPWYLYSGGVIGSIFIFGALFSLPKIGAAGFFGLVVLGQMLMTLFIDNYGILGMPIQKIDGQRVVGIMLLLTGCYLVMKNNS